jgi:hypothetical protein
MSDKMSDNKLNRRDFFKRAAVLGAAITGAASFLAACEPSGGSGSKEGAQAQKGGDLDCTDTSGLKPDKIKMREELKYTDDSSKAGKLCSNCQFYEQPKSAGECGGCKTVPGPIHPKGWCTIWAAKA